MKFEKITYQRLFSLPNYENERLSIEGTLEVGEDAADAFKQAKDEIIKSFKALNPQLDFGPATGYSISDIEGFQPMLNSLQKQPLQSIDPKKKDEIEIAIDNATKVSDLEFYVEAAEKYGLMDLYNQRLNSLL